AQLLAAGHSGRGLGAALMKQAVQFLSAFAQAMATMSLYKGGHPARERAVDSAYQALLDLQAQIANPVFTFLGEELVCGNTPIRELKQWDWGVRLSNAGIQRLEFEPGVDRADFEEFLEDVLVRLTLGGVSSAETRQMRKSRIRFGTVGVKGELTETAGTAQSLSYSLGVEAEAIRWLHREVQEHNKLHLGEAEAVVRSLSVAMHGDRHVLIPLLNLREFDQYTTSHALNVSVLAMALAEFTGLSKRDVRAFGVSGLLHDIGKTQVPIEILTKPGKLEPDERAVMNNHTIAGARIIIETEEHLDLAAVVAYEHHIMIDGGGYPKLRFSRDCHYASKLVHVCDVYDALRTVRPYRDAWPADKVIRYIRDKAGFEFDAELAGAFIAMMQAKDAQIAVVTDEKQELNVGTGSVGNGAPAGALDAT
ncbi:MAG TPA: HD domain-containing phosphohydrolase, partial [Longimicrobiales bacterium]|nr:HD domain-containing phosphohydrolase [Longimicrobiales bacterium]